VTKMKTLGPFPTTVNKNEQLLTFVDRSTQNAKAIPTSEVTIEVCAFEYAAQVIARYGVGL
jgi:hypothetical protein